MLFLYKICLANARACPWCKKEKQLLRDNNIEFEYVEVDLCSDEDYEKIEDDLLARGGRFSFPAIIIDDRILINGFKEEEIRESLEI